MPRAAAGVAIALSSAVFAFAALSSAAPESPHPRWVEATGIQPLPFEGLVERFLPPAAQQRMRVSWQRWAPEVESRLLSEIQRLPPDWRGPVDAYRRYATRPAGRQLGLATTAALLAILLRWPPRFGVGVAFVGSALIIVGSVSEFWLLTDVSYRDPIRATAWSAFLLGHLVFLVGYLGAWLQARGVEPAGSSTLPYS